MGDSNQTITKLERTHEEYMEKFGEASMEEAKRLQAVYEEQFRKEFDGLKIRVAELEECLKAKDEEIAHLSQLQATLQTLSKFGNLGELGQTIAALGAPRSEASEM